MSFCFQIDKPQTVILTKILDVMNQYFDNINLESTPDGICLINMDDFSFLTSFISKNWFQMYQFSSDTNIYCSIDLKSLNQILKQINKKDIVKIYNHYVDNELMIGVEIKQPKSKRISYFNIDCFITETEIKGDTLVKNMLDYSVRVEFAIEDFKSVLDQVKIQKTENVKISYSNQKIIFSFDNKGRIEQEIDNISEVKTIHTDKVIDNDVDVIVNIDKLTQLSKCLSVSRKVELYLQEMYPMCINFSIDDNVYLLVGISLLRNQQID